MPIEAATVLDPLFEKVLLAGDGKPFLTVVLVLDGEAWHRWEDGSTCAPIIRKLHKRGLPRRQCLSSSANFWTVCPKQARIRTIHLMPERWIVNNGFLAAIQKARQHVIEARFTHGIEDLYRGHWLEEK